jgi:hypothetical protein
MKIGGKTDRKYQANDGVLMQLIDQVQEGLVIVKLSIG